MERRRRGFPSWSFSTSPSLAAVALLASVVPHCAAASAVAEAATEKDARDAVASAAAPSSHDDVLAAVQRGWWKLAGELVTDMRKRGVPLGAMAEVRAATVKARDDATAFLNLLRVSSDAESTSVACAFQWAQRPEYVYLNVKFSSRIDGPTTVLNVDDEKVAFGNSSFDFTAMGRQKPKRFRLQLDFFKEIDPERSYWSFASVGRMSVTLAKVTNETWSRLLSTREKPKNMHLWYDRQQSLDADVKKGIAAPSAPVAPGAPTPAKWKSKKASASGGAAASTEASKQEL